MPKARYTRDKERGGYRYNFRQANGKYTTLRAATAPEMDDLIRQRRKERDEALAVNPPPAKGVTVADVAGRWLRVAEDGLSLNGRKALENSVRHVLEHIGQRPIQTVTPADIDDMLLSLPGNSASLRNKVLSAARRICGYAIDNGDLLRDPTKGKRGGGKKSQEVEPLTREQQTILIKSVEKTRAFLFCLLLLRTGLRPEEARGLTWDAIDLTDGALYVRQTVVYDGNKPIVQTELKSINAKRRIPLPRDLAKALKDAKEKAVSSYVLPGNRGPMSRQEYTNMWRIVQRRTREPDEPISNRNTKVVRSITFPVHPYTLRHTYITELCAHSAETGLDIKTIQYLAGHANPQTTLKIYAHVMATQQQDTSKKIQAIFDESSP